VTGRPNVKISFPKQFQAIQWTIEPDQSWNYQRTQVTHTLRATSASGILSGTSAVPTTVDIQLLRGKYNDFRAQTSEENRIDYGIQLALAETIEPDNPGNEEKVHYVSFQFDVNPLVLLMEAKNIKDQISLASTVLTLFLSALAGVKVVKAILQRVIDKLLLRRGEKAPKDVLRRKRVLEEISQSPLVGEVKKKQHRNKKKINPSESGSTSIGMAEENPGNQDEIPTSENEASGMEKLCREVEALKKDKQEMEKRLRKEKQEMEQRLEARLVALEQKNTE